MIDVPSEVISCNLQQLLGIWRNRDIFLRSPNILSRTAEHFSRPAEHFSVAFDVISAVQVNPLLNDFCGEALFGARPQVFSQIKQTAFDGFLIRLLAPSGALIAIPTYY